MQFESKTNYPRVNAERDNPDLIRKQWRVQAGQGGCRGIAVGVENLQHDTKTQLEMNGREIDGEKKKSPSHITY